MKSKSMLVSLVAILLVAFSAAGAAKKAPCSIHPKKDTPQSELAGMAKVTQADAQKTALAILKDPTKATIKQAELESEHGCLVFSFDVAIEGKTGVQEIQVDAGTGKVLSSKHESAKAEAAEKAKEAPKKK